MEQESKDKKPNEIIEAIDYIGKGLIGGLILWLVVIPVVIFGVGFVWGYVSDAVEGDCMVITTHQSYIDSYGHGEFMKINGSIRNNCDEARQSKITATFFDTQNRVLGSDFTYTRYKSDYGSSFDGIPMASTGRFELSTYGEPINPHNVDHYTLVVERKHAWTESHDSWVAIMIGVIIIIGVYFCFFSHTCVKCGKWLSFRPKICPKCETKMNYGRAGRYVCPTCGNQNIKKYQKRCKNCKTELRYE